MTNVVYSPRERVWLGAIALGGLGILNGIFVYALVFHPGTIAEAMRNPVALAFIVEALVLTGVLAYLLHKWQVSRLPWAGFVALALIGGLAFAVPLAVLWTRRSDNAAAPGVAGAIR